MSEVKVNKISPRSGTDVTLGDASDTFTIPASATLDVTGATVTGLGLAALTDATVSSSDPAGDSNPSAVGHLWINSTSGEAYIATRVTTDDNYWTNIASGSGNIAPLEDIIDYLVVAGGGGAGDGLSGAKGGPSAGGGAGGYRASWNNEASGGGGSSESGFEGVTSTVYTITVGAGGAGSGTNNVRGTDGDDSSISGSGLTTITSVGGGGGGAPPPKMDPSLRSWVLGIK